MKTDIRPTGAIRLDHCTYGLSKIPFRGPRRPTDGRFVACLGGSDTFGRYIAKPFPDLLDAALDEVCVNLGCQSAGPDAFLQDPALQSLCHDAVATVIQIFGASNLTNPYYRVHPRRNDRFIAPTDRLTALYPEIDFAEIAFTGHLIAKMRMIDEERFAVVRTTLEATWRARMKDLIAQSNGPVMLLWLAMRAPEDPCNLGPSEPTFITRAMVESLRGDVADIIEVVAQSGQTEGMCYAPLDSLTIQDIVGVEAHKAAAKALRTPLHHALCP